MAGAFGEIALADRKSRADGRRRQEEIIGFEEGAGALKQGDPLMLGLGDFGNA